MRGMPQPRIARSQRRDQLVAAALDVAEREGVPAMSVRRVAEAANVSLGLVHYCFTDKDDLVAAVASRIVEELEAAGVGALVDVGAGSLGDALRAGVRGLWASLSANRSRQLVTYEITTHALRQEGLHDVAVAQYRVSEGAVSAFLLHAAMTTGHHWTRPVEDLAGTTLALIDGVTLRWLVDGDDEGALARLDAFADALVCDACEDPLARPAAGDA